MASAILKTFLILLSSLTIYAQSITVVIDAGHGGKDPGHESMNENHLPEKDLNLLISTMIGGYLENNLQNIKVIYTRTSDVFLNLDERVEKANKTNADVFISIHCNGSETKMTKGTETHVHNLKSKKSMSLAKSIEKEFSSRAGRKSRGIKSVDDRTHSIQVLKHTKMTSVLVECGFLTNTSEANFLNTTHGQEILASAIFRGIRSYVQSEFTKITFTKSAKNEISYGVQIMSSIDPIDTKSVLFKKLPDGVERKRLNTTKAYKYIYVSGNYDSKKLAERALEKIRKLGFKDAIIVKLSLQ